MRVRYCTVFIPYQSIHLVSNYLGNLRRISEVWSWRQCGQLGAELDVLERGNSQPMPFKQVLFVQPAVVVKLTRAAKSEV